MTTHGRIGIAALVFLTVGLLLGFTANSAAGDDCGSVFSPAYVITYDCGQAMGPMKVITFASLGLAVLLILAYWLIPEDEARRSHDSETSDPRQPPAPSQPKLPADQV